MAGMTPAELGAAVSECLASTSSLLSDLVGSQGSRERDAALPSLFRRSAELQQRLQEEDCTVAVLAAIKSGKSTLLNALLGNTVLPSNNVPETARIVRLQHAPGRSLPLLSYAMPGGGTVQVEGVSLVREHLRQLNAAARGAGAGSTGSPVGSRGGAAAAEEAPLVIQAPIASLAGAAEAAAGGGRLHPRLALLDTPGPNEAGQAQLRYKVERLLEGVDAVLYLLDYTKLKSSDEAAMLQRLHELNPQLIRRISHRMFFVVNKMDMAENCEGMDAEETRAYVAAMITDQLGLPGFELLPEQVFTISAREALLSRLVLGGRAEGEELDKFRAAAFGRRWRTINDLELFRETAGEMLAGCGLPELEAGVMSFLGSRAAVLHLVALLDDHERLLAQVHNLTRASAASLHRGVAELQAQAQALRDRLADTLGAFEGVRDEVAELEGLVVDEVRERMGRLRTRLEGHISEALSPERPPVAAPRGRWPAVWAKAKGLLGLGGGEEGGMDAQERLQMTLCELHSLIYQQVEAEVRDFWGSLEQSTNARQRQLFSAINARIAELSSAVEAEVSLTLCCQLEPVDMRLRTPSAEDFHCSLQELLERGIQRKVTVEEREGTTAVPVFVKRQRGPGLCTPAQEWWEPVTEERTGPVHVERVSYCADLAAIRHYFVGIIDSTTQNSVRAVRHYVRAYLAERLEEARGVLQAYADQYTAAMMDSLEVARQGEDERSAALGVAEAHSAAAAALLDRVWELQREAEEMLEGWGMESEEEEAEGFAEEGAAGACGQGSSGAGSLLQEQEGLISDDDDGDDDDPPPGLVDEEQPGSEEGALFRVLGESSRVPATAAAAGSSGGSTSRRPPEVQSGDLSDSDSVGPPPLADSWFLEEAAAASASPAPGGRSGGGLPSLRSPATGDGQGPPGLVSLASRRCSLGERAGSGESDDGPPPLSSSGCLEEAAGASLAGGSRPAALLMFEPGFPNEQLAAALKRTSAAVEAGMLGSERSGEPAQQQEQEDGEEVPALVETGSVCSDDSDSSAPGLVAASACSADDVTPPLALADSMLSDSSSDEPPPLLGDSVHSAAGTAGAAGSAPEPAGPAEAGLGSSAAARSSSRAAEAAAAYQAAETARLAAAPLPAGDGEEGASAEVLLQEDSGSFEAEAEAKGADGSAADGGSGDEDWTVVSAGSQEEEEAAGEEAQAGDLPPNPGSA